MVRRGVSVRLSSDMSELVNKPYQQTQPFTLGPLNMIQILDIAKGRHFLCPGLKGLPGSSSNRIVCLFDPFIHLSVIQSMRKFIFFTGQSVW